MSTVFFECVFGICLELLTLFGSPVLVFVVQLVVYHQSLVLCPTEGLTVSCYTIIRRFTTTESDGAIVTVQCVEEIRCRTMMCTFLSLNSRFLNDNTGSS